MNYAKALFGATVVLPIAYLADMVQLPALLQGRARSHSVDVWRGVINHWKAGCK